MPVCVVDLEHRLRKARGRTSSMADAAIVRLLIAKFGRRDGRRSLLARLRLLDLRRLFVLLPWWLSIVRESRALTDRVHVQDGIGIFVANADVGKIARIVPLSMILVRQFGTLIRCKLQLVVLALSSDDVLERFLLRYSMRRADRPTVEAFAIELGLIEDFVDDGLLQRLSTFCTVDVRLALRSLMHVEVEVVHSPFDADYRRLSLRPVEASLLSIGVSDEER